MGYGFTWEQFKKKKSIIIFKLHKGALQFCIIVIFVRYLVAAGESSQIRNRIHEYDFEIYFTTEIKYREHINRLIYS